MVYLARGNTFIERWVLQTKEVGKAVNHAEKTKLGIIKENIKWLLVQ